MRQAFVDRCAETAAPPDRHSYGLLEGNTGGGARCRCRNAAPGKCKTCRSRRRRRTRFITSRRIGRSFRVNGKSAEERRTVRREHSRPLVEELQVSMREQRAKLSRGHDLAKAIDYILKRWAAFTLFLDDGRACLSNNAAERAVRGIMPDADTAKRMICSALVRSWCIMPLAVLRQGQGMCEEMSRSLRLATAWGFCLAVAATPVLGDETSFDGIYSGKRVLKKGEPGPTCPAEDDISVTIYGELSHLPIAA